MQNKVRIAPIQLIDQNKQYSHEAIKNVIDHLPNVEKDYYSVAIIGVQNSGKSTLLNHLFGTNFDVLHTLAGTRTTRGILVSLDKQQNFIVMDVEGNDSMERSQDQDYEKMVSTFALTQADVLIINIWAKSLGQYTGSQYQTLTTILDICISQFKQQSPKTLLFCVRDFNQQEDDEGQIRRKITKDVTNIWQKAQKPAEYEKYLNTPQKFFAVQVAVLNKYKQKQPKLFLQDLNKLRARFVNSKQDGYIFKSKKTSFNLPLKDLDKLMENSWQSIKTNKKLNLPNEKQQLSNFRCSQILNDILLQFKNQIHPIQKTYQITDFGSIYTHYVQQFEKQTYNYGKHIVQDKQALLKQQLNDKIKMVIQQILDCEQKKLRQEFRSLSSHIDQQNSKTLQGKLTEIKNQTVQKFLHVYKQLNFEVENRKEKVQKLIAFFERETIQIMKRNKEIAAAQFQKQSSRCIRLLSSEVLKTYFGIDFWKHVEEEYIKKRSKLVNDYGITVLWCQNRTLQANEVDAIDEHLSEQLKRNIRDEFEKSLMNKVFDIFLNDFTRTKDGVSYNFNILEEAKIVQLYNKARDHSRQLVNFINNYNVRRSRKSTILEFQENQKDQFFQATWLSNSLTELDKKMIHQHETIIRRKKQNEMKKVPIWLIVFIIYFVYDDIWFSSSVYPVTNFILTLFLIFVAFFFAIGQQNAFMELWNLFLDKGKQGVDKARKTVGK